MPYSFRPSTVAKSFVSKYGISPKIAEFLSTTYTSATGSIPAVRAVTRANKYKGFDFEMKIAGVWRGIEFKATTVV